MTNCANYGSVTHYGKSSYSYIGGIAGYSAGNKYRYLNNNVNYGTIDHNGTTSVKLHIGGILGMSYYSNPENCVNAGDIITNTKSEYIGGITGSLSKSTLFHCYWNENDHFNASGPLALESTVTESLSFNDDLRLSEPVAIKFYKGDSLVDALNAFSDSQALKSYSHWLLNRG